MKTKDAFDILDKRMKDVPDFDKRVAEEELHLKIADIVYDIREKAGMTQKELAVLIGTSQPAIARIEDADYKGHSLNVLARIAHVLGYDLEISLKKRDADAKTSDSVDNDPEHVLEAA